MKKLKGRTILFYPTADENPICLDKNIKFPFSYDYLIQCFSRLLNRKDINNNANFYFNYFMFLKLYTNFDYKQVTKKFEMVVDLSFTDEVNDNVKFEELNKLLLNVFSNSFVGKDGNKLYYFTILLNFLY